METQQTPSTDFSHLTVCRYKDSEKLRAATREDVARWALEGEDFTEVFKCPTSGETVFLEGDLPSRSNADIGDDGKPYVCVAGEWFEVANS